MVVRLPHWVELLGRRSNEKPPLVSQVGSHKVSKAIYGQEAQPDLQGPFRRPTGLGLSTKSVCGCVPLGRSEALDDSISG